MFNTGLNEGRFNSVGFFQNVCIMFVTVAFALIIDTKPHHVVFRFFIAYPIGIVLCFLVNNSITIFKEIRCFFKGHHEYVENTTHAMQCKRCGKKEYSPSYWKA